MESGLVSSQVSGKDLEGETSLWNSMKGAPIGCVNRLVEAGEDHFLRRIVVLHLRDGFADRDFYGEIDGESVNAATDGWEGERAKVILPCNFKTGNVATCEEFPLAVISTIPHWADGVNDVVGGETIAPGELCLAGFAAAEQATLVEKFWTGSAMNRSVNPSTAQQGTVGGVDDGIDGQGGDVGFENLYSVGHGSIFTLPLTGLSGIR